MAFCIAQSLYLKTYVLHEVESTTLKDRDRYMEDSVTECDDVVAQHELGHAWDTLSLQPTAIPLYLGGRNRDPAALRSC